MLKLIQILLPSFTFQSILDNDENQKKHLTWEDDEKQVNSRLNLSCFKLENQKVCAFKLDNRDELKQIGYYEIDREKLNFPVKIFDFNLKCQCHVRTQYLWVSQKFLLVAFGFKVNECNYFEVLKNKLFWEV